MKDFITIVIEDLKSKKQKEFGIHEKTVKSLIAAIQPKQSKISGTNLVKRIYGYDDELNIVLVGHLYLERYLNEILNVNIANFEELVKKGKYNSFHKKATYIITKNISEKQLINDILIFNRLRNKFAHKLNYNIIDFDIFQFSFLNKYSTEFAIKNKNTKRELNRILLRHSIYHLFRSLTKAHRFLHLIDEE